MFIEINPADANERGIKDGGWVWVTGAELDSKARMKALVTERVGQGRHLVSVPLRRLVPGRRSARQLSEGCRSDRAGRERQHLDDYGFDPVTGMQEPKATLCQIRAA